MRVHRPETSQAIQYLTADYQPTRVQTAEGIQRLTKNLAPFGLTKAEKLQVVNLTPVEPVELYVVRAAVAHTLPRLTSVRRSSRSWRIDWGIAWKKCSRSYAPPSQPRFPSSSSAPQPRLEIVDETPADDADADAPLWEPDANDIEYLDAGEGVGIEGDLDVDDE